MQRGGSVLLYRRDSDRRFFGDFLTGDSSHVVRHLSTASQEINLRLSVIKKKLKQSVVRNREAAILGGKKSSPTGGFSLSGCHVACPERFHLGLDRVAPPEVSFLRPETGICDVTIYKPQKITHFPVS